MVLRVVFVKVSFGLLMEHNCNFSFIEFDCQSGGEQIVNWSRGTKLVCLMWFGFCFFWLLFSMCSLGNRQGFRVCFNFLVIFVTWVATVTFCKLIIKINSLPCIFFFCLAHYGFNAVQFTVVKNGTLWIVRTLLLKQAAQLRKFTSEFYIGLRRLLKSVFLNHPSNASQEKEFWKSCNSRAWRFKGF